MNYFMIIRSQLYKAGSPLFSSKIFILKVSIKSKHDLGLYNGQFRMTIEQNNALFSSYETADLSGLSTRFVLMFYRYTYIEKDKVVIF
jgi:hypothetical protein